jgi:copper oxidase (laccase) domain-containing protein
VIDAWRTAFGSVDSACSRVGGRWRFDLKAANRAQLLAHGLKSDNIEISRVCTASDPENWFSHRAQGPSTGRFAAIISIAGSSR